MRELKRKIILLVMPRVVWGILWLLYASCKNRFFIHESVRKSNMIVAFWHGELLMQPYLYRQIRQKPNISVLISEHFDGEIIAKLCEYYGIKSIRGSSSKNARKAFLQALKTLENGCDVAITPDGPRGPYHSVADGIVAMAQKTGTGIVAFRVQASRYWQLKSWDKFQIPKPFSTINYYAMPLFTIDKGLEIESAKELICQKMTTSPSKVFGES